MAQDNYRPGNLCAKGWASSLRLKGGGGQNGGSTCRSSFFQVPLEGKREKGGKQGEKEQERARGERGEEEEEEAMAQASECGEWRLKGGVSKFPSL